MTASEGREVKVKIRHYALLLLTVATIVFMQPLVLLLGNLVLLGGVFAFIYSDLPPASQQAWDNRVTQFFRHLRRSLRKKSRKVKDLSNTNEQTSAPVTQPQDAKACSQAALEQSSPTPWQAFRSRTKATSKSNSSQQP